MSNSAKSRLFIEALPLTTKRASGIGHMLASLVREMERDAGFNERFEPTLFGPLSGANQVGQQHFKTPYKTYPLRQKAVTALNFMRLLPPVDIWLGKGVYLFGNFSNYPLSKKSKSLTYAHDASFLRYPEFVRPKVRRVLQKNLPLWLKRTDRIIAVSEHTKQELIHFYKLNPSKISVVPNGIDPAQFYPRSSKEITAVKAKYGLPEQYVLFLSNIEPRKNLERLIRAHVRLPEDLRSRYPLLIVGGESWLNEGIEEALAAAESRGGKIVRPSKYVKDADLPALHSGAIILAHPAIYEGFGISPLQALACGTPVLAANASSLPEVLGEAALYVDPLSEDDIAAKLQTLLEDEKLRQELKTKGLKRAQQFTWQKALDKLLKVLNSLG